jgi:hypothetical protein
VHSKVFSPLNFESVSRIAICWSAWNTRSSFVFQNSEPEVVAPKSVSISRFGNCRFVLFLRWVFVNAETRTLIDLRFFTLSSYRLDHSDKVCSDFSTLTHRLLSDFSPFCLFRSSGSWEAMARECKVTLKSSDAELFDVDEAVAFESQTIKNMIESTGTTSALPLPNVSSKILAKVIEYCKYHIEAEKPADEKLAISEDEIKTWDQEFVKFDQATLIDLI